VMSSISGIIGLESGFKVSYCGFETLRGDRACKGGVSRQTDETG